MVPCCYSLLLCAQHYGGLLSAAQTVGPVWCSVDAQAVSVIQNEPYSVSAAAAPTNIWQAERSQNSIRYCMQQHITCNISKHKTTPC
jgi:hypothetical protein